MQERCLNLNVKPKSYCFIEINSLKRRERVLKLIKTLQYGTKIKITTFSTSRSLLFKS